MEFLERIEWNPRVCNGKPVIKGTRIPLGIILEQIAQGSAWDQLLRDYPELKKEDIQAALFFAKANIEHFDMRKIHGRSFRRLGSPSLGAALWRGPVKSESNHITKYP